MTKFFTMVTVVFALVGCSGPKSVSSDGAPPKPQIGTTMGNMFFKPYTLDFNPPPGPPEYQQGWADGCETGMHSYTNSLAKFVGAYQMKQDPNLVNNNVYYQVWKDAFLYCAIYMEANNKFAI